MKYQLITTLGSDKNVGDAFIRIGVENRVRATDPEAEFVLTCKETDPVLEDCDVRIWCGMPLIWDGCEDISWWDFLKEFASQPNAQIWGAGSCVGKEFNADILLKAAEAVKCPVTARDSLLSELTGWKYEQCPAFRCIVKHEPPTLDICNWHPDGGHYRHLNEEEVKVWDSRSKEITRWLANPSDGWVFVAHNQVEADYAKELGYTHIYEGSAEELLKVYARARSYRGHRVHGAIAARSAGCDDVMCIGWESRMMAVSRPDEPKKWFYPSEITGRNL